MSAAGSAQHGFGFFLGPRWGAIGLGMLAASPLGLLVDQRPLAALSAALGLVLLVVGFLLFHYAAAPSIDQAVEEKEKGQ